MTSLLSKCLLGLALAAALPAAAQAAAPTEFTIYAVLDLDRQIEPGDFAWNDQGAPAGRTVIVVDLKAALLYVYRGGFEIGRSSILYGADEKPTPTGTFPILEKDKDHISNLYHAPMPYMLRLTWCGISIHATDVDDRYATHGCVGVPPEFAQMLFSAARVGDQVIVTKQWLDS